MTSFYNTSLWQLLKLKLASKSEVPNSELLATLKQLSLYETRTRHWNGSRRTNLSKLSWKQQKLLDQIGYTSKIAKVDTAIRVNQKFINEVIEFTKRQNNLTYTDMKLPVESRDNYRVIESLCHFQRDWSPLGDVEIEPILSYIESQTAKFDKSNTMVITPGSGLGRIAHELAKQGFQQVQSIEFSMLMKIFNEFIYSEKNNYMIHPFIHSYSNQVTTANQLRDINLQTLGDKPLNLDISYGDFNKFEITANSQNVVIVTVFFIDTLENLFQYLETINKISLKFPGDKTWINIGPLKYGTRPKVELNLKELTKLIKLLGWDIVNQQDPKLLGYLTDLQGMWQGQYGVSMITCKKKN